MGVYWGGITQITMIPSATAEAIVAATIILRRQKTSKRRVQKFSKTNIQGGALNSDGIQVAGHTVPFHCLCLERCCTDRLVAFSLSLAVNLLVSLSKSNSVPIRLESE